jgi:membrane associated rhomboid family serine protease
MANTIPLVVLGSLILLQDIPTFLKVTGFVIVVGGSLVWMLGRTAYHVGASGLVMGYFGFLLARAWASRSLTSIVLAVVAVLMYGGMLLNFLPGTPGISWEMHLFGLIAGLLAGWLFAPEKGFFVSKKSRKQS